MKGLDVGRWTSGETSEEVPPELVRLLRAARDERAAPGEVAELGRRLATLLGPASGLPGAEAGQGALAPSGVSSAAHERREPASGQSAETASGPRRAASRPESEQVGALAGAGRGARVSSWKLASGGAIAAALAIGVLGPRLLEEPGGAEPAPPPAQHVPALPASGERPSSGAEPEGRLEPESVDVAPSVEPQRDEPAAASPPRAPAEVRRAHGERRAAKPAPPARALDEASLLRRAQAALGERPGQALSLAREHARRFPDGALAQEREVIAISALERLGREREAAARAQAFERRWRGSVHQPRLERGPGLPAGNGGAER